MPIPYNKRKEYFKNYYKNNMKPKNEAAKAALIDRTPDVIISEQSCEKYFMYWMRFVGKDIREKKTGKVLTKGQFYRKYPEIAENLADESNALPDKFEIVYKPAKREVC